MENQQRKRTEENFTQAVISIIRNSFVESQNKQTENQQWKCSKEYFVQAVFLDATKDFKMIGVWNETIVIENADICLWGTEEEIPFLKASSVAVHYSEVEKILEKMKNSWYKSFPGKEKEHPKENVVVLIQAMLQTKSSVSLVRGDIEE